MIHAALVAAAERYALHEPLIESGGDRDAVRRGRVGTRRLRSHLRTFARLVDPAWAAPLRTELGILATALGDVRDADVRLARYTMALRKHDQAERSGGQTLLRRCRQDRRKARARLLTRLQSEQHRSVQCRLSAMIAAPVWLPAAAAPASQILPRFAKRQWQHLQRAARSAGADAVDAELHAVRIATKRTRYAVEAMTPLLGGAGENFAAQLSNVQTVLGTYHDAMISVDWLRRLAPQLPSTAAFVAGVIGADEMQAARRARATWPDSWSAASKTRVPW